MPITRTNPCPFISVPSHQRSGHVSRVRGGKDRFPSFEESPLYSHLCPKLLRKLQESLSSPQFICLLLYTFRLDKNTSQQITRVGVVFYGPDQFSSCPCHISVIKNSTSKEFRTQNTKPGKLPEF